MFIKPGLVASLLLMLVASVSAQPPGRRGGGFGRRGFGMDDAQASASALLRMPEVRKELETTDEQNSQIDEALAALNEQMRLAAARETSEAAQKKADEKLAGILNAKQVSRLEGLRLQREGAGALLRPEVAKKLGLTEQQREQLRAVRAKSRSAGPGGASFQSMSEDERREFSAQMQKRRETTESEMLAVLTAEQRQTIDELKGNKFAFPQSPQRGFGGGFGAGGGGFGRGGGAERKRPPIKKRAQ
ncbi:MAG TPA: Spy/CpxP family protein refolding chaperone [Pirellulales bacterium]|nr:Spy/CpxP family protein refolding chaperone [Pirellulales bacterium]